MSVLISPSEITNSKVCRINKDISDELANSDIHPLLQQLYANRGIKHLKDVQYSIKQLPDYKTLKDIQVAASIIGQHVIENKKIIIIGDFDADGATSSALVVRALSMFGAMQVSYLVPNRFEYGYGLSPEIVALAAQQSPDLIITVDNGIASIEGVLEANCRNIKVVITDHHLPADTVPEAAAIVNPNQHGCEFPYKSTAGVGVAFYVMLAARAYLRDEGVFKNKEFNGKEPNMAALLDLVALGTVADVVPLDENNRLLVELGLQRIRQHRGCVGINALLSIAGKNISQCHSQDFGFVIGPRLNAAGRLEDMSIGIECLLTDDNDYAMTLAQQLDEINHQRKQIEGDMLTQALKVLENEFFSDDTVAKYTGLSLYHPDWHQGVVGLLASRVKEKYFRPVFAFAKANFDANIGEDESSELKGSGRSIPGLHLRDVLDLMSKKHPDLIIKFGGHAMAAGLSIYSNKFELFQQVFDEVVKESLDESALKLIKETDGAIPESVMTMETSELIKFASTWGQAFPAPLFDDVFTVENWRIVGLKHLKLVLKQVGSLKTYDAIAFNMMETVLPEGDHAEIRVVYRLDINEFRGNRNLQLIVDYIEAA